MYIYKNIYKLIIGDIMEVPNIFMNQAYTPYIVFVYTIIFFLFFKNFKSDNIKVLACYYIMFLVSISNIIDKKIFLSLFMFIFYIYNEYLVDDEYKSKIINTTFDRIIDTLYLVYKYKFVLFVISLFIISNFFKTYIIDLKLVGIFISFIILMYISHKVATNSFEVNKITDIYHKLGNFNSFNRISKNKSLIITDIEDKTFYIRRNSYTLISVDYLKHKMKDLGFNNIFMLIKYFLNKLGLNNSLKSVDKIRGYSTIEMQTFKTLSIKSGFNNRFERKIYELVYTSLYFKGLKRYFKTNYDKVTDKYYKDYILNEYNKCVPIIINGKYYKTIKTFWKKEYYDLTDEEYFLTVLTFSGRIDINKLSYEYIKNNFSIYESFNILDKEKLKSAINNMKETFN